jgi:hypothetical protein
MAVSSVRALPTSVLYDALGTRCLPLVRRRKVTSASISAARSISTLTLIAGASRVKLIRVAPEDWRRVRLACRAFAWSVHLSPPIWLLPLPEPWPRTACRLRNEDRHTKCHQQYGCGLGERMNSDRKQASCLRANTLGSRPAPLNRPTLAVGTSSPASGSFACFHLQTQGAKTSGFFLASLTLRFYDFIRKFVGFFEPVAALRICQTLSCHVWFSRPSLGQVAKKLPIVKASLCWFSMRSIATRRPSALSTWHV